MSSMAQGFSATSAREQWYQGQWSSSSRSGQHTTHTDQVLVELRPAEENVSISLFSGCFSNRISCFNNCIKQVVPQFADLCCHKIQKWRKYLLIYFSNNIWSHVSTGLIPFIIFITKRPDSNNNLSIYLLKSAFLYWEGGPPYFG